jgi:hypothetical protein
MTLIKYIYEQRNEPSDSCILMAATLIVGATFSATTAQSAFAYQKKKVGGTQDGGSKNSNTVTIEECKNRGSASGFDTALDQECENLICTHPGNNATCVQEGAVTTTTTATTPTTPVKLTCEQCFRKFLTPDQITIVVSSEPGLAGLCMSLQQGFISESQLINQLNVAGVSETIQAQLIDCLINAGLPFEPLIV